MKITDALAAEHSVFLTVFDQIDRALPSLATPAEIRTMASVIEGMLEGHAARECSLAFLALDHALAEKGHLEHMHQEHEEIDERLRKVHSTHSCAEARRLLKAAIHSSREHFRLEERIIFPLLERALKPDTLAELGRSWIHRNRDPARAG